MTIGIQVKDQCVITEKTRSIVANSVNFVSAVCSFDEEWNGTVKHIVFTNGDISKTVAVTDGESFAVPYEVLLPGKLEISAVGYGEQGEIRITTKKMSVPLLIHESGRIEGGEAESYTPELWEHIAAVVGDFAKMKVDADTLVDAINLIAKAEGSDGIVMQKDDSGFFQTVEDNDDTAVFYLHDKKTLADSKNVIKLTAEQLCVSNDGGNTYPFVMKTDNAALESISKAVSTHQNNTENPHGVTAAQVKAVPEMRRVNGYPLSGDITLTASDLGAVPENRKINGKALNGDITLTADDVDAVAAGRKINGKTLENDITLTAADVGAEVSGTSDKAVSVHDTSDAAHGDIRTAVQELSRRLNTLANSDDVTLDQLSEIISYIKSNKTLIESITEGRVAVSDIVNDLVTSAADRPLSAAQGRVLKDILDGHTGDTANPHKVTAAQAGAAPAGYGLGGAASFSAETIDEIRAPGWYRTTNITIGENTFNYAYMRVDAYNNTGCMQILHILGAGGISLRRLRYGGEWYEWEWIHPAMRSGVEYRTTERHNGKAVYVCRINTGALPSNGAASFTLPSAPGEIVHLSGLIKGTATALFPVIAVDGTVRAVLRKTGTQTIGVYTFADLSGYTAQIDVKYTK